jgi:hypothetical protein
MRQNCLKHAFAILEHLIVPEAKHLPALVRQISVTDVVANAFGVLRTVGFHNQLSANTKKVDNVGADRNLSAKLESAQATIAQKTPEAQFAVRRRSTHRSGAGALVRRDACVSLHRSSIGGAALIRPASPATFSPREKGFPPRSLAHPFSKRRKGTRAAVWRNPSPSGRRWPAKPAG